MFFKAGVLSFALLLASRVLGLVRESAQAAAFGASGLGDVAVLMLSLPDWLAGVLSSGALAYVLLPHWARETPAQQDATQKWVQRRLLWLAAALALLLWLAQGPLAAWLLPGAAPQLRNAALVWSALALPAALLAGLWGTRLQHECDFVGLYSANLVVNAVVIAALLLLAWGGGAQGVPHGVSTLLGLSLLAAMLLRLAWQGWRLHGAKKARRLKRAPATAFGPALAAGVDGVDGVDGPAAHSQPALSKVGGLPGWHSWLWAALAAGLPLTLPFAARSLASAAGAGALAVFNYAWKLVELPLVLAIQLVAALAFPAIARAHAHAATAEAPHGLHSPAMVQAVRSSLALAWTLACAAAAALVVGAPALASLLFGWGRMQPEALAQVAAWGATGAWGLLPQALAAVALTVLATLGRLRLAVLAYALALAVLLLAGAAGLHQGGALMGLLNVLFCGVALAAWWGLGPAARQCLPVRAMLVPLAVLLALACAAQWWAAAMGDLGHATLVRGFGKNQAFMLACSAWAAILVIASGWFGAPQLREALRS